MNAQAPIRILGVDDHTLFRRGLTALLEARPRFCVVGEAGDAGEALRRAGELQPDVILLDHHLPGVQGVDALQGLRQAAPQARVLMLTVSEDDPTLADALRRGASVKGIARTLDIAEATVKIHVQHILRKLNLTSRVQAAVYAAGHVN
jgi:two-component system nitrate/nitrite response regulator NarL